jgi:Predicted transcriptional regulators
MDNECSKVMYEFRNRKFECSLELAMEMIGGKWKPLMLSHLEDGALRSGELQRTLKGITNKMFTQTARELEEAGLIERIVYPVVPPKVEYRLTSRGESIIPIIVQLKEWGKMVGSCQLVEVL